MNKNLSKLFFVSKSYTIASALMLALSLNTDVYASAALLVEMNQQNQQQEDIQGKVNSTAGPVAGATVYVKGNHSLSTSTDANGNFTLKAPKGSVLVISMIGYESLEHVATSNNVLVDLVESSESLDEVVVVGFGVQKKS